MATSRFRLINGVWQGSGSAAGPTMPPAAPVLQSATPGDSQVTLAWSGVHSATGYQALVNGAASGMQVSSASETIFGLVNGTLYAFAVQAIGPGGTSVASNMIRVSPKAAAPGSFVIGTTMPIGAGEAAAGGQRVGVPSGTTLKNYDGDITNIANGQKISGLYIKGKVKPNAKVNFTIDSCEIVGGGASNSNVGLVENFTGGAVTVTNSLLHILQADVSSGWIGLYGYNITARFCEIMDVVDCCDIQGAAAVNTVLEAVRMHRLTCLAPDAAGGGRPNTHNDCIQWQGGTGLTVRGCNMWADLSPFSNFTAYSPSATGQVLTVTPNTGGGGPVGDLIFGENWIDYGQYQIDIISGTISQSTWPSMQIGPNRFGRHVKKFAVSIAAGVDIENFPTVTGPDTLAGNVYADNGAKVTITVVGTTPVDPPPPITGPAVLPTGTGVYTYQQTGKTSIQAASAWVATQAAAADGTRTLTFPAGIYTIVPDFGGAGGSNTACNLSTAVSHIGQGVAYTIWQVQGTFAPGTQDPMPTTGTNSAYVVKQEGGTGRIFQGIKIDAETHQIVDQRTLNAAGGANAQKGKTVPYNIMRMHTASSPEITNVLITGGHGTANTPPGETFSFNLWDCHNAIFTDVEIDGAGTAGALFGVNGANNGAPVTYIRCYAHDSGHSHGWAMFQAGTVNRTNCRSDNNGSGTGSSGGVGFNNEGSGPVMASGDTGVGNSLCGYRFEAGPIDGGSNRTDHKLTNCTSSGSPTGLRTAGAQTTVPTMVSCSITGTVANVAHTSS